MNFSNEFSSTLRIKQDYHLIIMIAIWSLGTLFTIIGLAITFLSKSKLLKSEFYIFVVFATIKIAFKLCSLAMLFIIYYSIGLAESCAFTLLNFTSLLFISQILMTLFYHSLHQISNLSRNRFFIALHEFTHNLKNFFIFEIVVAVILITFTMTLLLWAFFQLNCQCPNLGYVLHKFIHNYIAVELALPSTLPISIYTLATIYIVYSRFLQKRCNKSFANERQKLKRFRKNVHLLIKCISLSFTLLICSSLLAMFYFLAFIRPDSNIYRIVGYFSFTIYAIESLVLLSVHSVLKKTLMSFIYGIFRFK